jgi:cytochrome b involved in lipid metabolism
MSKTFTREEVAKHDKDGDAWIIVDNMVYDISKFAPMHPGGELLILQYAGKVFLQLDLH